MTRVLGKEVFIQEVETDSITRDTVEFIMEWAAGRTPSAASLGAGVPRAHGLVGARENRQVVSCYASHLSWLN